MKKVLVIQSSPLGNQSVSRQMTDKFLKLYASQHADCTVTSRDLAANPLPHLSGDFVGAMFVPPDSRTREMNSTLSFAHKLTDELKAADDIVISAPMYNYTVPSSLKAWIDHIVLPFTTFKFGPEGREGLVKGKTAYFICATGDVYSKGPRMRDDFLTPYIKHILGFIGIEDVRIIQVEGVAFDRDQGWTLAEAELKRVLQAS